MCVCIGKREGGGAYQRASVGGDVEGPEERDFEHEGRRKTSGSVGGGDTSRSEHLSNWRSAETPPEKEEDVWNLKSPPADTWQVVGKNNDVRIPRDQNRRIFFKVRNMDGGTMATRRNSACIRMIT